MYDPVSPHLICLHSAVAMWHILFGQARIQILVPSHSRKQRLFFLRTKFPASENGRLVDKEQSQSYCLLSFRCTVTAEETDSLAKTHLLQKINYYKF